jgi:hypothetical protein
MDIVFEILQSIPAAVAFILALAGLVPFFMALKKPPKGFVQTSVYGAVYVVGAIGTMSLMTSILLPLAA